MLGIIEYWYIDISCFPSHKQTKCQQENLEGNQGWPEFCVVMTSALREHTHLNHVFFKFNLLAMKVMNFFTDWDPDLELRSHANF